LNHSIDFVLDNKPHDIEYAQDYHPMPNKGDVVKIRGVNYDVYEKEINMKDGKVTIYARTR